METKSSLPTYRSHGILAGLISAAAGTLIFAIFEQIYIYYQAQNQGWPIEIGVAFFLTCPLSFAFSCIPGIIGGKLLEVYLRNRLRKGKLTRKDAVTSGMALAALAGVSVCALVIWFMFSVEPVMAGVNDVAMEFPQYFWQQAVYFRVEIAAVLLITCICGGRAGSSLLKHLYRIHTEPSL